MNTSWDQETDVVVVGYGYSGGVAAIVAHDLGASVTLLEKMEHPGGNSILSGGFFRITDDVDKAFAYLKRMCPQHRAGPGDPHLRQGAAHTFRLHEGAHRQHGHPGAGTARHRRHLPFRRRTARRRHRTPGGQERGSPVLSLAPGPRHRLDRLQGGGRQREQARHRGVLVYAGAGADFGRAGQGDGSGRGTGRQGRADQGTEGSGTGRGRVRAQRAAQAPVSPGAALPPHLRLGQHRRRAADGTEGRRRPVAHVARPRRLRLQDAGVPHRLPAPHPGAARRQPPPEAGRGVLPQEWRTRGPR